MIVQCATFSTRSKVTNLFHNLNPQKIEQNVSDRISLSGHPFKSS